MNLSHAARKLLIIVPWLCLLLLLPIYPVQSIHAALSGISIWWEVLFPALFPFFVITELLLGFGLVHFIGCLFDPMMRPLFRVPGFGGFVMAMGFASGYPIGARLTSQLWESGLVTREEGERLVAFTSTSDPIFLIGAVSVGFFHDAGLAVVLAAAHYGGGILIGLLMRFHGPKQVVQAEHRVSQPFLLKRAIRSMHEARIADGRPLGQLLHDAVKIGLKLVFMIGGLVIFVSVMMELLTVTGMMNALYAIFSFLIERLSVPGELAPALVNGLFEVTLGAKQSGSAASSVPLLHQTAMAAFILSWAGLSVHAQIVSLLSHTDLRYVPFAVARLLHGLIAALLVYLLWQPLGPLRTAVSEAMPAMGSGRQWTELQLSYILAFVVFAGALLAIPILAITFALIRRLILIMMGTRTG